MKVFTNIVFLCLLLYVSSLSMKHNSALNSFLQTKFHYGSLNQRAKNFRIYGQMLQADCTTKKGETKFCYYNINRRLKLNRKWSMLERGDKKGEGFMKEFVEIKLGNKGGRVYLGGKYDNCYGDFWNNYCWIKDYYLDQLLAVDDYGNLIDVDILNRCGDCYLVYGKFKCSCEGLGEINLNKRIRNKEGKLEWFFKNYEKSCVNIQLKEFFILTAECFYAGSWHKSSLNIANYIYVDDKGYIKSY